MDTYNQTQIDSGLFLEKIETFNETHESNHSLIKQEVQNEVLNNPDEDCSTGIIKQKSDDQVEESIDIKIPKDDSNVEHSDSSKFCLVQSGPAKSKWCKCDICGKEFTWPSQLKQHLLIHSGTKPYQCSICSKSFTQAGSLKKHLLCHSDEKPRECSY